MDYRWTCSCCGTTFDTLPMDYAHRAPDAWVALSEAERSTRAKLDSNLCAIDQREFYVRGCIEVPVPECDDIFAWGVWASVPKESFWYILDKWTAEIPADEPPIPGRLCNRINAYPDSTDLRCSVHLRSNNLRPRFVLEPTDHPLAIEQRDGITLERVKQIFAEWGH
jgi:hypothetical protein